MRNSENTYLELWNSSVNLDNYGSKEQYYNHILEQYKLVVESAEKVSSRRSSTNGFFLTMHTFFMGASSLIEFPSENQFILSILTTLPLLLLCYAWWRVLKSYRQLNSAKFKVIGEYEMILPTSPYCNAEWAALGRGKIASLYRPITDVENMLPAIFSVVYIILSVLN